MKKSSIISSAAMFIMALFCSASLLAQETAPSKPSPAATATGKVGEATITVNYSSPAVKGRNVWAGNLAPYGKVWRSGANEATTVDIDRDITVEGKTLPAGKYSFFTIPGENEWTIIFNKVPNQWGAFRYDEKQDALRVTVKPRKSANFNERLVYTVSNNNLVLSWENVDVPVSIK